MLMENKYEILVSKLEKFDYIFVSGMSITIRYLELLTYFQTMVEAGTIS